MAVDTEGDTGHAQIQTAADYILCCQDVLVGRSNVTWNTSCRHTDSVTFDSLPSKTHMESDSFLLTVGRSKEGKVCKINFDSYRPDLF